MAAAYEMRRSKGSTQYPPPTRRKMATSFSTVAVVVAVVVAVHLLASTTSRAEAAVLAKSNNGTYGGCRECRIAEDLELEMLLVDDLYYATVHVSRMLQQQGHEKTPTQKSGNPNVAPCKQEAGQQNNCTPPSDNKKPANCPDPYNRNCH